MVAHKLQRMGINQNNDYKMKKCIFTIVAIAAIMLVGGCAKEKKWGEAERNKLREELRAYRDMIYLDNLAEAEFVDFSGDVVEAIEIDYPIYTTFVELPGRGDTVEVYVVSTIVEELNTDPHNLRNIFPYPQLVADGVLPAGLNHQAQRAFYDCLSHKIKRTYRTTLAFFDAITNGTQADSNKIADMQMQCAADLFDWGVEVDETIVIE